MDSLQPGRRERKYLLFGDAIDPVRQFVKAYLQSDEATQASGEQGYLVHTLYLDAPHLELYQRSVLGKKKRFKLRMRFYDDAEDGVVYLEVKQRRKRRRVKYRAPVPKQLAAEFLEGRRLTAEDLAVRSPETELALEEFTAHATLLGARPTLFTSFRREGYDSAFGETARITLDRLVSAQPFDASRKLAPPEEQTPLEISPAVLELKHEGPRPDWARDLARNFGLKRTSYPKYVHCVRALGMNGCSAASDPLSSVQRAEI